MIQSSFLFLSVRREGVGGGGGDAAGASEVAPRCTLPTLTYFTLTKTTRCIAHLAKSKLEEEWEEWGGRLTERVDNCQSSLGVVEEVEEEAVHPSDGDEEQLPTAACVCYLCVLHAAASGGGARWGRC